MAKIMQEDAKFFATWDILNDVPVFRIDCGKHSMKFNGHTKPEEVGVAFKLMLLAVFKKPEKGAES